MNKNRIKDQEEKRKPRRLSLSRETIRPLNDPALLELAKGGALSEYATNCTRNSVIIGTCRSDMCQ